MDVNCNWHKECGYDLCHGEGVCLEFQQIKAKKPKKNRKEIDLRESVFGNGLKHHLKLALENDTNYDQRYKEVIEVMYYAMSCGYQVGIRIDPSEPEWPVVYIELPTGQVSWHMPQHNKEWDGHSTEEKVDRVKRFIREGNHG